MLTQYEKNEIASHLREGNELPVTLKQKFDAAIAAYEGLQERSADENLCCDTGLNPPNRYIWTTFDNCRALGGRAADNAMCGH